MKWAERIDDPNVWRVYKGTVALSVAYGMALSLIAIFLDANGFSKSDIGSLALSFGLGIVTLSLFVDRLIERFTARVTLVTSFFGYAVAVAVFPFLESFTAIAVARFFDGIFSVGIWVSAETILLSRSRPAHKAFTMSLYAVSIGIGYVFGPGIAWALTRLGPLSVGFVGAGVLSTLAGVYVLLVLEPDSKRNPDAAPAPVSKEPTPGASADLPPSRLTRGQLIWRIKNSCFQTFAYGYFQASVVLFLPLFLMQSKGVSEGATIWIPAFFAAGMLIFTNPVGLLGDRIGHLRTMRGLATIGAAVVAAFVFLDSYPWMCVAVLIAGATLASISPVSLALQGVSLAPEDYSRGTAVYNTFYAAGMLLGPKVSALIFERYGGPAMLYHLAALWCAFVLFSIVFYRDDPAARPKELEPDSQLTPAESKLASSSPVRR